MSKNATLNGGSSFSTQAEKAQGIDNLHAYL